MTTSARIATGLIITSMFLLAACASSPVHYYTLVPPATREESARPTAPFVIDVVPVGIPAQLDQQQMVVRSGAEGVTILDAQRWAAPLGDELRTALSSDLVRQLNTQDVAGLSRPVNRQVLVVRVQIRRFDAWPGVDAGMDADWSVRPVQSTGSAGVTCHTQLHAEASGRYAGIVRVQQRIVDELAGQIARTASDAGTTGQYRCPD
ncbi:PqiC family protein [Burkholderia seminalis]|uniref:PqiC family protein n=1 Tax=Burkholderia seminalis TaxID=488731 RepID=UPI001588E3A0|nr:PqiC family protein [Burkholderia seminalis]